jgi:hypothetical protein
VSLPLMAGTSHPLRVVLSGLNVEGCHRGDDGNFRAPQGDLQGADDLLRQEVGDHGATDSGNDIENLAYCFWWVKCQLSLHFFFIFFMQSGHILAVGDFFIPHLGHLVGDAAGMLPPEEIERTEARKYDENDSDPQGD